LKESNETGELVKLDIIESIIGSAMIEDNGAIVVDRDYRLLLGRPGNGAAVEQEDVSANRMAVIDVVTPARHQ